MNFCLTCQSETDNPKYCSRSCSAKETNKVPKRKAKPRKCSRCIELVYWPHNLCDSCRNYDPGTRALQEVIHHAHHKSSAFAYVRTHARAIAKSLGWNTCILCSYNKHVEIAHIKAINTYPLDTIVNVINDVSNLLPLCPNCHWEFDHGLLSHEQRSRCDSNAHNPVTVLRLEDEAGTGA